MKKLEKIAAKFSKLWGKKKVDPTGIDIAFRAILTFNGYYSEMCNIGDMEGPYWIYHYCYTIGRNGNVYGYAVMTLNPDCHGDYSFDTIEFEEVEKDD